MDEEVSVEDAIEYALGVRVFAVMEDLFQHCHHRGEDGLRAVVAMASGTARLLAGEGYAPDEVMRVFHRSLAFADAAGATQLGCEA